MKRAMQQAHLILTCGVLWTCVFSGCKSLQPEWTPEWLGGEEKPTIQESKYPKPTRLAVIWTPAVLNHPGKKPTRGFGGRIYFYDAANKAVPVEGQLVVYAYNDSKVGGDGKTPDRRYAFTPEQFTTHFSPTELGASYSVWIPWDEAGNPQLNISLVSVFTASSGQLVVGQPSQNLLPGPTTPESGPMINNLIAPSAGPQPAYPGQQPTISLPPVTTSALPPVTAGLPTINQVQQAAFQQGAAAPAGIALTGAGTQPTATVAGATAAAGVETMSIHLPGTMASRLAAAGPQTRQSHVRMPVAGFGRPGAIPNGAVPPAEQASDHQALAAGAPANAPTAGSGAIPRPWSPQVPRLTHSLRPRLAAPASPGLPPASGLPPMQQYPAARQLSLPSSPQ